MDPSVILPVKDFLEISVISGEAVPSKYRPVGSQGYHCFQGQNRSQENSSAVITERELGNPFALRISVNTVTKTEQKFDLFA